MKISLYDIKDPVLIFEAKTGITYFNQCGGCSCSHMEMEGFILPYQVKSSDSEFFNPTMWYNSYGWDSSNVREFYSKEGVGKTYASHEVLEILSRNSLNYKDIRKWRRFNDLKYTISSLYSGISLCVNEEKPSIEAWLYVSSPEFGDGVLTWENCD